MIGSTRFKATAARPPGIRRRGSRRRGITIIETMVVMTGVATMLSLCAVTIQLLLRLNADGHARLTGSLGLERLSRQIRDDAHTSGMARLDPQAGGPQAALRLVIDRDHEILYEPRPGAVARTDLRAGKVSRRESYPLAPGCAGLFELREESKRTLVVLSVRRAISPNPTVPARTLEVMAVAGMDRAGKFENSGAANP